VWAVAPNLAVEVQTLDQARQRLLYDTPQFGAATMGAVASLGLLLVALGVFSVMAYAVSLRTQEFGVRLALGADSRDIVRMVIGSGVKLIAMGALVGTVMAGAAGRVLESQLVGVSASDPTTFATVLAVIVLVGTAACWSASRRVTHLDPLDALRAE
jgi:ABC-type antimicrobial peptide transport system permease subunit